jgi:hypothetical protein
MNNNVASIEKIRQAIRALHNALEAKGEGDKKYNLMMGIAFAPVRSMNADQLIKAVEDNKKVSQDLVYGMQAGLKRAPALELSKDEALKILHGFEQELGTLPQDIGATMTLEFTVSNQHENEIVQTAQKTIEAFEGTGQKVRAVK